MSAGAEPEENAGARDGSGQGELLYCGTTRFDTMGRKLKKGVGLQARGNLVSPTRLLPLVGVDIRFVASGCAACHCVALDADGRCFTWGRNEKGQLGHGDTLQRNLPTVVRKLSKHNIIKASVGRNHTVVVTGDGKSFAFGHNKHGQLGTGYIRTEIKASPVPCLVTEVTNAVCGADFTVWLSSVEGSSILTAGLPQYGQLGHGSNNQYNTKAVSISLLYDPQPHPRAIAALSGKMVVKVACGTNHTVAVDSSGFVYTWGFGGYGRLGHREQKDEWQPRLVEVFQKNNVLHPNDIVSAGSASSACTGRGGELLYMWGKVKRSGDEWMYPKALRDLSGWNIRCMASGEMHHAVGADDSCISWGLSLYGQLGYGPTRKSSVNPKKVDILEGMHVTSVGCGVGLSLIVVDRKNIGDKLDQLDIYNGTIDTSTQVNMENLWFRPRACTEEKGNTNTSQQPTTHVKEERVEVRKLTRASASTNLRPDKRKKTKDHSESEDDDEDEDEPLKRVRERLWKLTRASASTNSRPDKRKKTKDHSESEDDDEDEDEPLKRVRERLRKLTRASASTNSRPDKRKKTKDHSESEDDDEDEDEPLKRVRERGAKKSTPEPKPFGRGRGCPKKTQSPVPRKGESLG